VFSGSFANTLAQLENPYGQGGASLKIKNLLKQTPVDGLLKKHFYDLKVVE
jgi:hypothetical protein